MKIKNKIFKKIIYLGILFSPLFYNNASANLDDGLIGYWNFDNFNGQDSSGNGNDAVVHGSKYIEGVKGNAIYFENAYNGGWFDVKDYVSLPNMTLNDFSVSLWTKFYSASNFDPMGDLVSFGDDTVSPFFSMRVNSNNGVSFISITSNFGTYYVSNIYNLNDDNWHNIVVTKSSNYLKLYLDNNVISTIDLYDPISFLNAPAYLGYHQWYGGGAGSSRYYGIVDELKIYNRVLDASEVNKLYTNLTKPSTPTKLNQYVKSPELDEEEIKVGEKIGKFQSGSGIILRADTDETEATRLIVDIYKSGEVYPIELQSEYNTNSTKEITLPYLGVGDYSWSAKIERQTGGISDAIDFGNNPSTETDFSLFEGFEPYPYGYKFGNAPLDSSVLNGGLNNTSFFSLGKREKVDGNKWDIFYKAFDTTDLENDERKLFDTFEMLGLNRENPDAFSRGSCYGLSTSALMQKYHPDFMKNNYTDFSNEVGAGTIMQNIKPFSTTNNEGLYWNDINNPVFKDVLSLQLSQGSEIFQKAENESRNKSNIDILNEIKNNTNKNYVLGIEGKNKDGVIVKHYVVPYKVEGNKIFIWDNNISYPNKEINEELVYGNKQYLEINNDNSIYSKFYIDNQNWKSINKINLVPLETIYNNGNKAKPAGLSILDRLIILFGNSSIIIKDASGNISGFRDGNIYREIPGVSVNILASSNSGTTNTKQIYLPQNIEGLSIEVSGITQENYDLMIAGGDYYTKLSGINTSSGQTDTYNISRENMKIDFDDNKIGTGTYDILVDDFQNNGTGTVYIPQIEQQKGLQTLDINWTNVINNSSNAVIYQADTNNDGIIDISKSTKAIENPQYTNAKKSGISGKINILEDYSIGKKIDKLKYNDIILMLEKEKDEKDEHEHEEKEGKEKLKDKIKSIFTKRQLVKIKEDGTFDIDNLEAGKYKLEIVNDNLMNKVTKPEIGYYELEIKKGFDYINRDFDVIKGYKLKDIKDKLDNLKHK